MKLQQYTVEGMTLYRQHCSNCHQVDGSGLARLIPPLEDSDYLRNLSHAQIACQIRYGLDSAIVVNGIEFTQPMEGHPKLTALEIAEIVTYIDNTWGAKKGLYLVKSAEKDLENCRKDR